MQTSRQKVNVNLRLVLYQKQMHSNCQSKRRLSPHSNAFSSYLFHAHAMPRHGIITHHLLAAVLLKMESTISPDRVASTDSSVSLN